MDTYSTCISTSPCHPWKWSVTQTTSVTVSIVNVIFHLSWENSWRNIDTSPQKLTNGIKTTKQTLSHFQNKGIAAIYWMDLRKRTGLWKYWFGNTYIWRGLFDLLLLIVISTYEGVYLACYCLCHLCTMYIRDRLCSLCEQKGWATLRWVGVTRSME